MNNTDPPSHGVVVAFPGPAAPKRVAVDVCFNRRELSAILSVYGRMVAAGEWRDYALDHRPDFSSFSVFRRAAEHPLYRIEKRPANARKQGQYSVTAMDGRILKRGQDLKTVLRVFEAKLTKLTVLD